MLNQRQIEILLEFCNHTEEYLTASYFADKLNVSLRTVQGDMKAIKTELEEESCAHIESKASKGSCIVVEDADELSGIYNSFIKLSDKQDQQDLTIIIKQTSCGYNVRDGREIFCF